VSRNPAFKSARLTPDLVAVVARKLEDRGPAAGVVVHNEDDYEASLQAFLGAGAWQEGQAVWVFGYGSQHCTRRRFCTSSKDVLG